MKTIKYILAVVLCFSMSFNTYSIGQNRKDLPSEEALLTSLELTTDQVAELRIAFEEGIDKRGLNDTLAEKGRELLDELVRSPENFLKEHPEFELSYGEKPIPPDIEEAFWNILVSAFYSFAIMVAVTPMLSDPSIPTDPIDFGFQLATCALFQQTPLEQCYEGNEEFMEEIEIYSSSVVNDDGCGDHVCENLCDHFRDYACIGLYPESLIACLFSSGHPEWGCDDYIDSQGNLICP